MRETETRDSGQQERKAGRKTKCLMREKCVCVCVFVIKEKKAKEGDERKIANRREKNSFC